MDFWFSGSRKEIHYNDVLEEIKKELHLDISPSDKKERTSRFADMMIGYAKGVGFACKVKPDAFAATSVADKHNK